MYEVTAGGSSIRRITRRFYGSVSRTGISIIVITITGIVSPSVAALFFWFGWCSLRPEASNGYELDLVKTRIPGTGGGPVLNVPPDRVCNYEDVSPCGADRDGILPGMNGVFL